MKRLQEHIRQLQRIHWRSGMHTGPCTEVQEAGIHSAQAAVRVCCGSFLVSCATTAVPHIQGRAGAWSKRAWLFAHLVLTMSLLSDTSACLARRRCLEVVIRFTSPLRPAVWRPEAPDCWETGVYTFQPLFIATKTNSGMHACGSSTAIPTGQLTLAGVCLQLHSPPSSEFCTTSANGKACAAARARLPVAVHLALGEP